MLCIHERLGVMQHHKNTPAFLLDGCGEERLQVEGSSWRADCGCLPACYPRLLSSLKAVGPAMLPLQHA